MTRVRNASLDAILVALDPLPESAPAVVTYQPDRAALKLDQIVLMQQELERAAIRLFPAWLPGAEQIAGPQGAGVAAVRSMASRLAKANHQYGHFLPDLAEAALRGSALPNSNCPPATRSSVAAWAISLSYGSEYAALAIDVPEGLSASDEVKLTSAADWIAGQSGAAVWLTGAPLTKVDKYIAVTPDLDEIVEERTGPLLQHEPRSPSAKTPQSTGSTARSVLGMPPLAGVPRADSLAECALEKALSKRAWAEGRSWNQTYHATPLTRPFRLDLWWKAEKCVVEVDGPEHHSPLKYAADRRRDVQLQLDGHAVLRYTNDQVLGDLDRVIFEIGRLLRRRRSQ